MTRPSTLPGMVFCVLLALIPVLAVSMPRCVAFMPGVTGLAGLGLGYKLCGTPPTAPKITLVLVGVIAALALLSSLWGIDLHISLVKAAQAAGAMLSGLLLICAVRSLPVEQLKPALWLFPAGLLLAALLVFTGLHFGDWYYRLARALPVGTPVPPAVYNRVMTLIALCLFPAIAILRRYVGWKIAGLLLLLGLGSALSIADSQSAQLAIILGLLTALLFPYRVRAAWVALAGGLAGLMLAAPFLAIWVFHHYAAQLNAMPMLNRGFAGARLEIWDYVSRYMLQNPLYGFGFEATRQVPHFDSAQIFQAGTTILHPHNFAIQIWMETGLIGVLIFGALLSRLVLWLRDHLDTHGQRFCLPALIAMLSVSSTGYGMWQGWWIGAVFLAAGVAILAVRLCGCETINTAKDKTP